MHRRRLREPKTFALLAGSAALAGLSPLAADLGSSQAAAALPQGLHPGGRRRRGGGPGWAVEPDVPDDRPAHGRIEGQAARRVLGSTTSGKVWAKGAMYSALFLGLLFLVRTMAESPPREALSLILPLATHLAVGALFMPLATTILETFDGSPTFFSRLVNNACRAHLAFSRSAFCLGLHLIPVHDLMHKDPGIRFLLGAGMGAMAYAGVSVAVDLLVRSGAGGNGCRTGAST